ncbi:MAG: ABC transporter ATPase, partial [Schleiferiaceae bacterium]
MPLVDWNELPAESRFWCFVADRPWTAEEEPQLVRGLQSLCAGWAAHGEPVYAGFQLVEQRVVALAADEARTAASGCS